MTGNQLRDLRDRLDLTHHALAMLIGVHVSSVYRWEARGTKVAKIERLQSEILEAMRSALRGVGRKHAGEVGWMILQKLLAGSRLAALGVALTWATASERP